METISHPDAIVEWPAPGEVRECWVPIDIYHGPNKPETQTAVKVQVTGLDLGENYAGRPFAYNAPPFAEIILMSADALIHPIGHRFVVHGKETTSGTVSSPPPTGMHVVDGIYIGESDPQPSVRFWMDASMTKVRRNPNAKVARYAYEDWTKERCEQWRYENEARWRENREQTRTEIEKRMALLPAIGQRMRHVSGREGVVIEPCEKGLNNIYPRLRFDDGSRMTITVASMMSGNFEAVAQAG